MKRLCVSKDEELRVLAELGFFDLWEEKGSEYVIDAVVQLPLFGTIQPKYLSIVLNPSKSIKINNCISINYLVDLLEKCESNMHQTISNNNEGMYLH